ncbi:hypothetical protein [Acetobacterium wieringae]|uniref:ORC-CDC6 family AAA ATPase n=1 Tax=Acetobacterium wieringae TaxID=52694 RepID=UPI0026EC73A4|nr:hypothetical protein [Acetobacterium wieringae]
MANNSNSLGNYIVDRTESLNDTSIQDYFIGTQHSHIERLLDSEQYILEGSRGIGKTMLMRSAEINASENFGKDSILAVWVNFEESLRIARIKIVDGSIDPFLQWTMGKILQEVLKKCISLRPTCADQLSSRLANIFNKPTNHKMEDSFRNYVNLLDEYIKVLERGDIEDSAKLNEQSPSVKLAEILDNPVSFKEFLLQLKEDFELERIVLLFDEAAHVFSHDQQEKFFTLFKSLRNPNIACKAAVYPGITNYGRYFEKGQDAKELRIDWNAKDINDINYIKSILQKRIVAFDNSYWSKLCKNDEVIQTICICSNGNPRFAFHIIDELDNSKVFTKSNIIYQDVIKAIRQVFENKWKDFTSLQSRLKKYESYIRESEIFVKQVIITNLRKWNENRRKQSKKLSIGFFIETNAYDSIPQIFDILAYHNIITIDYSKKSIGHNNYGFLISLNPSILFSNRIIIGVEEMDQVSIAIENNQAYYSTTPEISDLQKRVALEKECNCSNEKCDFSTNEEYNFCPKCGSKMKQEDEDVESLYNVLRSHDIDSLRLSVAIKERLKKKFSNIGEIYDAEIDEIRMNYIQDVRIVQVKNSVIEYMTG